MKPKPLLTDALHVFTLCGFALAQPLYDLLARNAEFFVAQRCCPIDIVALVAVLSFLVPAALVGVELFCVGRGLRKGLHVFLVADLAALIALPILKKVPSLSPALLLSLAAVMGAVFAVGYARLRPVRTFLTVLTPAVLLFPGLFLANPRVAAVLAAEKASVATPVAAAAAPVVLVVFDELPLVSLLDENRHIDAGRYPHFAKLAHEATWFRNTATVHISTTNAVPAILTGADPGGPDRLPTLAEHPHNLFTWLGGTYDVHAVESMTSLCPRSLTGDGERDTPTRLRAMLSDVGLVSLHLLLPGPWTRKLPPVTQGWKDFADCGCCPAAESRSQALERFLEGIQPTMRPTLHFLHAVLPHSPFCFLPSGQYYGRGADGGGAVRSPDGVWPADEETVRRAYQRHLLQVGYVDAFLGRLLDRLKEAGLYDRCLLVVTADHGCSFRAGDSYRDLTRTNFADILRVPLFVKTPGQRQGTTCDRTVQTTDVLPTLADGLGVPLPWPVAGESALSGPGRTEVAAWSNGAHWTFSPREVADDFGGLDRKTARFGSGSLDGLYRYDTAPDVIGRTVAFLGVEGTTPATVELEQPEAFANVDPAAPYVPACVRGTVKAEKGGGPLDLAVAVNDTVRAVTRVTPAEQGPAEWSIMVPVSAFTAGSNRVEIFALAPAQDGRGRLVRTGPAPASTGPTYALAGPKRRRGETLRTADGRSLTVDPKAVVGCLDLVQRESGCVEFHGWAADARAARLPDAVVVFADGRFFWEGPLGVPRPDVARALGNDALYGAGFTFAFPFDRFKGLGDPELRFFAVTGAGGVSELKYPDWYKQRSYRPLGKL